MVLELLGQKKPATLSDLIARKKYPEAMAFVKGQLKKAPGDTSLRIQLADILVLLGKVDDATLALESVADDFAKEGYAAKAIAVLKKIQKLDPRRKDLEEKIVDLFKTSAPVRSSQPAAPAVQFGMDEGEALEISFGEPAAETVAPEPPIAIDVADESPAIAVEEEPSPKRRISPLFDDFAEDELVEVVRGLELLTYEPGDIVFTEGEKGDSLYVLTSGTAKAFIKNKQGGNTQVRQLNEGDFFGEISILTGKPRTATITAAGRCELLRLDRAKLDAITKKRPHVRQVLQQFYEERTSNAAEAEIRGLDAAPSETLKAAGLGERPGAAPKPVVISEQAAGEDPTEMQAQHLRNSAIENSRKQNWADAVLAWQQYLALKPQDLESVNVLGVLFGKLCRWQEAAQMFERLVELKSTDPTVYFNLGLCYRQLNHLPQSAAAYRRAIALKPDYEKAKQNLTTVLNAIKKEAMA